MQPPKTADTLLALSSLAAHPTSSPSYSRPVQCCPPQLLANWNREPGHAFWPRRESVPNSPGAGRRLQPGPGCDCCHGYHAEGCLVAPPYLSRSRVFTMPNLPWRERYFSQVMVTN
jgi:hypothetical protein